MLDSNQRIHYQGLFLLHQQFGTLSLTDHMMDHHFCKLILSTEAYSFKYQSWMSPYLSYHPLKSCMCHRCLVAYRPGVSGLLSFTLSRTSSSGLCKKECFARSIRKAVFLFVSVWFCWYFLLICRLGARFIPNLSYRTGSVCSLSTTASWLTKRLCCWAEQHLAGNSL